MYPILASMMASILDLNLEQMFLILSYNKPFKILVMVTLRA